jgi:hypothetical protein
MSAIDKINAWPHADEAVFIYYSVLFKGATVLGEELRHVAHIT